MDNDFTEEMMEDINPNSTGIYGNFCLLDKYIFGRRKEIKEQWGVLKKPDCLIEVENYILNVKEATRWSLREPFNRCIKMLEFILDKVDRDIEQYCEQYGLSEDYEPTQEEIEKHMPNPPAGDFDKGLYEKCLEEGYTEALIAHIQSQIEELKGLDMLRSCLRSVQKEKYIQECKHRFTNVALRYKIDKSNKVFISDFIVEKNKDKEALLKQVFYGKKGKEFALYMIAAEKVNLLKVLVRSSFYKCIRESWKVDIGTNQSINKHLIKTGNKLREIREYAFFSNEEVENAINSIKSML